MRAYAVCMPLDWDGVQRDNEATLVCLTPSSPYEPPPPGPERPLCSHCPTQWGPDGLRAIRELWLRLRARHALIRAGVSPVLAREQTRPARVVEGMILEGKIKDLMTARMMLHELCLASLFRLDMDGSWTDGEAIDVQGDCPIPEPIG